MGLSSDELNFSKKGREPVYPYSIRYELLTSMRFVDNVFMEESIEEKRNYIIHHRADILVMDNDWKGKFDEFMSLMPFPVAQDLRYESTINSSEGKKNRRPIRRVWLQIKQHIKNVYYVKQQVAKFKRNLLKVMITP